MVKVIITKEQYDQVRAVEKMTGLKVAKQSTEMKVPDCINGQHGIYVIKRCYRSAGKYFAQMELETPANSEIEAILHLKRMEAEAANQGWKVHEMEM